VFVRFVIGRQDDCSHSTQGVFQAVFELRNSGGLDGHEEEWLEREMTWLRMHLEAPPCLRKPGNERAICWFHPRATKAIERVRSIAALLEEKGVRVRMLTTRNPGTVIYEDGHQIAAKPHRKRTLTRLRNKR